MAISEAIGRNVETATLQSARGGCTWEQLRLCRLQSFRTNYTIDGGGPVTTDKLLTAMLRFHKTCTGRRDPEFEDQLCRLIGTHDCWKVIDAIVDQLEAACTDTLPGDVTEEQMQDVLQGGDPKYIEELGVKPDTLRLVCDFLRGLKNE